MRENKKGYGNLTNIPKIKEVIMVTIYEGTGEADCPMRPVDYVYDKEYKLLHKYDVNDHTNPIE